jgi:hypothetical protein
MKSLSFINAKVQFCYDGSNILHFISFLLKSFKDLIQGIDFRPMCFACKHLSFLHCFPIKQVKNKKHVDEKIYKNMEILWNKTLIDVCFVTSCT